MAAQLSGPSGGSKYSIQQNASINVTPFVDVMLVLLIIFMVAAPLATVSVPLELPTAVAPPTPSPQKPIWISIQKNGDLHIGDFSTSIEAMPADLTKQIGKRDPTKERIYIRVDKDAYYGDFMRVMNTLQDNGYYSVALVGLDNSK
jgi:TonB system transport protein ExbD (group 1)